MMCTIQSRHTRKKAQLGPLLILKIRKKLATCIDPLDPSSHPSGKIVNIVTGMISPASVNVDDYVQLCERFMTSYREGWPQSFHKPLTKPIIMMSVSRIWRGWRWRFWCSCRKCINSDRDSVHVSVLCRNNTLFYKVDYLFVLLICLLNVILL